MNSFSREYLGSVLVDHGVIRITGETSEPDSAKDNPLAHAKSEEGFGLTRTTLYVGTAFREGRYSVFGYRNESGELTSIEIQLNEPEENPQ